MTSFATDGFLSSEITEFEKLIRNNYSAKIELAYDVNRISHELIYSIEIHNEHLPDLLMSTLLTRQATTFQAFIILISKGMVTQAEIILRNIAETMFIVGAIGKDETFADNYVLSEEISRKKALVRLKNINERNGKKVDQETLNLIADLEKRIKTEKINKFSTENIAKIAGLSDYYDSLYPLISMAVHTSTRGLDKLLQINDKGDVHGIEYGPVVDRLDIHLDYAISIMLYTLHELAIHFNKDVKHIEELQQKNHEAAESV